MQAPCQSHGDELTEGTAGYRDMHLFIAQKQNRQNKTRHQVDQQTSLVSPGKALKDNYLFERSCGTFKREERLTLHTG